jgi:hypothetical protein
MFPSSVSAKQSFLIIDALKTVFIVIELLANRYKHNIRPMIASTYFERSLWKVDGEYAQLTLSTFMIASPLEFSNFYLRNYCRNFDLPKFGTEMCIINFKANLIFVFVKDLTLKITPVLSIKAFIFLNRLIVKETAYDKLLLAK